MKLILLFILAVSAELRVTTFSTPGDYTFSPSDYGLAQELIVEVWGAGGGGCSGNCGIGGGSGAYIKSIIDTRNETFNIAVGLGGKGGNGCMVTMYSGTTGVHNRFPWSIDSTNYAGFDGQSSSFIGEYVRLIAGGGKKGNTTEHSIRSGSCGNAGINANTIVNNRGSIISSISNGIIYNSDTGYDGYASTCSNIDCSPCLTDCSGNYHDYQTIIVSGNGANSQMGGNGGEGNNVTSCSTYNPVGIYSKMGNNGTTPGGGGGGTYNGALNCQASCSNSYCSIGCNIYYYQAGYGGNGTVRITYEIPNYNSINDPSTTPSGFISINYHSLTNTITPAPIISQSTNIITDPTDQSINSTNNITGSISTSEISIFNNINIWIIVIIGILLLVTMSILIVVFICIFLNKGVKINNTIINMDNYQPNKSL